MTTTRPDPHDSHDRADPLDPADLAPLWEEIRSRMGVCPSFFRLAAANPPVARGLFDVAKFAYLDSPMPSHLKEQLFTALSQFCAARYCVTRHSAFLLGHGFVAGDPDAAHLSPEELPRC